MRRFLILWGLLAFALAGAPARGATGSVIKVLPHFLDLKERHALSPSLYDRDAYQAYLRQHPEERAGIRFDVQWKSRGGVWEPLKLIVQMRGIAQGELPKEWVREQAVEPGQWFSQWSAVKFSGPEYKELGEVTAWRVSLWEGEQLLGERKSFLW